MAELRDAGALGFTDDGKPVAQRRHAAQGAPVPAAVRRRDRAARGGPDALARRRDARGRRQRRARHRRDPDRQRVDDDRPRRRARRATRTRACTSSTSAASSRSTRSPQAKARGARVSAEVCPHHLLLTDEDVRGLDSRFKMNPPLADRGRPPGAGGGAARRHDRLRRHRPRAARAHEKEVPFEQAPMGTTGLETAFAALLHRAGAAGRARARDGGRADERGRRAVRTADAADRGRSSPPTSASSTSTPSWIVGERGYESRSANCCFAGRRLQGRVLLTVAAGAVAHRDRSLAMVGA